MAMSCCVLSRRRLRLSSACLVITSGQVFLVNICRGYHTPETERYKTVMMALLEVGGVLGNQVIMKV